MRTHVLVGTLALVAAFAACGSSADSVFVPTGAQDDAGTSGAPGPNGLGSLGSGTSGSDEAGTVDPIGLGPLVIAPGDVTIDVTNGSATPVDFKASVDGKNVGASFVVDRGELGSFDASGRFTPGGNVGGKATVTATIGNKTATTTITVKLHLTQNGKTDAETDAGADAGAGGAGGVGGEGSGDAATAADVTLLTGNDVTADAAVKFIYPYDQTVFPRGLLPPLLMWDPGTHKFDSVSIVLKGTYFDYQGTFAKTAPTFLHHPIPKDVWNKMVYSNGGEDVTITVKLAEGGKAYGPITRTWKIAQGTLKGTVYYNSYDSKLANGNGAVLALRGDSTDPVLVAGTAGDASKCRVCHTVSTNGSTMIGVRGDGNPQYGLGSVYDLTQGNKETQKTPNDYRYTWPAMYPDGSFAVLSENSAAIWASWKDKSSLIALPSGDPITTAKGFPSDLIANMASFSADGKLFTFLVDRGTVNGKSVPAGSLMSMTFDKSTMTFGEPTPLYAAPDGRGPGWPLFLPNNQALVFSLDYSRGDTNQTAPGFYSVGRTENKSELWTLDVKTQKAVRLDRANGVGVISEKDATHNAQPTINPIISGGYAWMIFTSRREYGNAAPPTTKKLWVAAIDLDAPAGSDPSHPAFYLPAQEFASGNSRAFSVLDPCKADGAGPCVSGDECCGGYCRQASGGTGYVCTAQVPSCAQEFEKCTTAADCCAAPQGTQCVAGRCAIPAPSVPK